MLKKTSISCLVPIYLPIYLLLIFTLLHGKLYPLNYQTFYFSSSLQHDISKTIEVSPITNQNRLSCNYLTERFTTFIETSVARFTRQNFQRQNSWYLYDYLRTIFQGSQYYNYWISCCYVKYKPGVSFFLKQTKYNRAWFLHTYTKTSFLCNGLKYMLFHQQTNRETIQSHHIMILWCL